MQRIDTRTIHTIVIDVQDDVLAKIQVGDEVEVVLNGRNGQTARKRLTYRDTEVLLDDNNLGRRAR